MKEQERAVIMGKNFFRERVLSLIYFDNSATTAIYPQALNTYVQVSQRIIGNPSSLHDLGNQANRLRKKPMEIT